MDETYKAIKEFPEALIKAYNLPVPIIKKDFRKIVIIGLDEAYLAGLLLKEMLKKEISIPIEVHQGDFIHDYENDLVVLISYSAGEREILRIFKKLTKKLKENLLILTSNKQIIKKAEKRNSLIKLPKNIHPKLLFPYYFSPLIKVLVQSGIIKDKKAKIKRIAKLLKKHENSLEREAIKLSLTLKNENPLFYVSKNFLSTAYKLQIAIEKNAKTISHINQIPELFYNEIECLPASYFYPVLIIGKKDKKLWKKEIRFLKKLIKNFYEIKHYKLKEDERKFLIFYFADFLSYHLARLKNIELEKEPNIEKIKTL